jgi:hypothetical protein
MPESAAAFSDTLPLFWVLCRLNDLFLSPLPQVKIKNVFSCDDNNCGIEAGPVNAA